MCADFDSWTLRRQFLQVRVGLRQCKHGIWRNVRYGATCRWASAAPRPTGEGV